MTSDLTPVAPLAARVVRWGKFWALEPLFADERHYLLAKGGRRPRLGDLVLAVPVKHNRVRIVEVLGDGNDVRAVLRALLYAEGVPQGFPQAVLDEAAAVVGRRERRDDGRVDLTGLRTFTIDPETATDFDDAISVARDGDAYRAWVHIADVSYYVDGDGAIDVEARRRTASVYLPLWAEPMLPEALSSDVCSLKPDEPRKCVTAEFLFSAKGERLSIEFYRSLIKSDRRLTYGFVDEVLGHGEEGAAEGAGGRGEAIAGDRGRARPGRRAAASRPGARRRPAPRSRARRDAARQALRTRGAADRLVRARVQLR